MNTYYDVIIRYYNYDKQQEDVERFNHQLYDDNLKRLTEIAFKNTGEIWKLRSFSVNVNWIYSISLLNKREQ